MQFLRQATASQEILLGPFLDSTNGNDTEAGLTIANTDIKLWKNGATAEVNKNSGGATHIASGRYYAVLDGTDTDTLGNLEVNVHVAGALAVRREYVVLHAEIYDALISHNGILPVETIAGPFLDSAGQISSTVDANVTQISGDSVAADNAEAFFDGTGYAGTNNVIPTVTTLTGHTPQTGDSYARLGAPAGASVSADVAAVKADTAAILTDTDTTIPGLIATAQTDLDTITGSDGVTLATAQGNYAPAKAGDNMGTVSAVTGGINTAAGTITTLDGLDTAQDSQHAQTQSDIAALNDLSAADVNAQVDTALSDIHLDHLLAVAYNADAKPGDLSALLNKLVESDSSGEPLFTTEALSLAPTGGSAPTAAAIADAVWEEAIADHSGTAGSTAEQLAAAGAAGDPWSTALPGSYTAGQAGKIVGDNLNAPVGTVDTVVDAIKAVTDNLPDSGALTSIATAAALATVDSNVDAILVDTGTTIPGVLGTPSDFGSGTSTLAANLQDMADNGTAVYDRSTDSLQAIRDQGDAAWITGNTVTPLDAAGVRTAVGLASANLDTQLDALPTAAENRAEMDSNSTQLAAIVADTNELQTDDIPGLIAALNDPSVADILTTQMTEAYSADGTAPTLAQALFLILSFLQERSVSGTTVTTKKLDGSATAATYTLDDATTPTSITRSG